MIFGQDFNLSHGGAEARHVLLAHFSLRCLDVGPDQVPLRYSRWLCRVRAGMFVIPE